MEGGQYGEYTLYCASTFDFIKTAGEGIDGVGTLSKKILYIFSVI